MRRLGLLLLPGALSVAAAAAIVLVPHLRESARPYVAVATYAVLGAGVLLGLRFGNLRVVVGLVVLALANDALTRWTARAVTAREARAAVALLLPLDLAALAWMSDRGTRRPRARLWTALVGAQALGVAALLVPGSAHAARGLWHSVLDAVALPWPALLEPAHTAFVVALALALLRLGLRPRPTESGLVWAIVAAFLAVTAGGERLVATTYLGAAALALIVGLVETSYAMAYGDELTGLPARRALNELLGELHGRYAVAMVDIDHFKKFNDTYGHQAGDQLLRKIAATLMSVSGGGRAFRYGGEEFAIVFPGFTAERATPHLEDLREAIAAARFTVRGAGRPRKKPRDVPAAGPRRQTGVTVSVGVADSMRGGPTAADVVKAADQALYRAKRAGRNRLAT